MALPADRWGVDSLLLHTVCAREDTSLWSDVELLNTALKYAPPNFDHVYVDLAPRGSFGCFHPRTGARKVSHAVRTLRNLRKASKNA